MFRSRPTISSRLDPKLSKAREIKDMKVQLSKAKQSIRDSERKNKALEANVLELTRKLKTGNTFYNEQKSHWKNISYEHETLMEHMTLQSNQLKGVVSGYKKELVGLQKEYDVLQAENDLLKSERNILSRDNPASGLQRQLERMCAENRSLQKQLGSTDISTGTLKSENSTLQAMCAHQKKQISELQQTLVESTQRNEEIVNHYRAETQRLRKEYEEKLKFWKEAEKHCFNLKKMIEPVMQKNEGLFQENCDLKRELSALAGTGDTEEEIAYLKQQAGLMSEKLAEYRTLQNQADASSSESAELRAQLNDFLKKNQELKLEVKNLQVEKGEILQTKEIAIRQNEQYSEQIAKLTGLNNSLQEQLKDVAEQSKREQAKRMTEIRSQVENLQKMFEVQRHETGRTRQEVESYREKNTSLTDSLFRTEWEIENLMLELEAETETQKVLKENNSALNKELAQRVQENTELRASLGAKEAEIGQGVEQRKELGDLVKTLEEKNTNLHKEMEGAQILNEALTDHASKVESLQEDHREFCEIKEEYEQRVDLLECRVIAQVNESKKHQVRVAELERLAGKKAHVVGLEKLKGKKELQKTKKRLHEVKKELLELKRRKPPFYAHIEVISIIFDFLLEDDVIYSENRKQITFLFKREGELVAEIGILDGLLQDARNQIKQRQSEILQKSQDCKLLEHLLNDLNEQLTRKEMTIASLKGALMSEQRAKEKEKETKVKFETSTSILELKSALQKLSRTKTSLQAINEELRDRIKIDPKTILETKVKKCPKVVFKDLDQENCPRTFGSPIKNQLSPLGSPIKNDSRMISATSPLADGYW